MYEDHLLFVGEIGPKPSRVLVRITFYYKRITN